MAPTGHESLLSILEKLMREMPDGYEDNAVTTIQKIYSEAGSELPPNTKALLEIYLGRIARSRYPEDFPGNFTAAYKILVEIPAEEVDPELLVEAALLEATRRVSQQELAMARKILDRTRTIVRKKPITPTVNRLRTQLAEALSALPIASAR